MSQLSKSQWQTKYITDGASCQFLTNVTQKIKSATMRTFSTDLKDTVPWLNENNSFSGQNQFGSFTSIGISPSDYTFHINDVSSGGKQIKIQRGTGIATIDQDNNLNNLYINATDGLLLQTVSGSVRIGITSDTAAVANASITGLKVFETTADNSVFHIAGFFQHNQSVSGTNSLQGVEGYVKTTHTSGTITLAIGTIGNFELGGNATVAIARSMQAGGNTSAAGTITEWDGLYVNFANSGGATITSAYGVYIDTFPSGVTNKWGIYVAESGAVSFFAGKIKYGTNTTGAGSALLGTNSPASTLTAPYTWFTFISSDGSTVYLPAWK